MVLLAQFRVPWVYFGFTLKVSLGSNGVLWVLREPGYQIGGTFWSLLGYPKSHLEDNLGVLLNHLWDTLWLLRWVL